MNKGQLGKKIEGLLDTAPNTRWKAYALPDLPEDVVLVGYGIKVTKDDHIASYILATRKNFHSQKNPRAELLK